VKGSQAILPEARFRRAVSCREGKRKGELRVNPNPLMLLQKAQALDRAGKALEASAAYREFLERKPKHADAWADYAGQLLRLSKLEEAEKACAVALAIDPRQLSARINLGCVLRRRDRPDEAESQFRSVLAVDPYRMDAQLFLAECLFDKRDLVNLRTVLEEAKQSGLMDVKYSVLNSHHAELWVRLSSALFERQEWGEAETACRAALQIDPRNFWAKSNLGSIWMAQGHLEEAAGMFRQLLVDRPRENDVRLLLITCLTQKGDLGLADREIAEIIQQNPHDFGVHKKMTGTYYSFGRWAEYRAEIERFRRVAPDCAQLDYALSRVDLLLGNMPEGWERFEARLQVPGDQRPQRTFEQSAWRGEPFAGKTLLLWAEQGLGDTLMFVRYVPRVKALGGRVIVEVQSALSEVAATCSGADLVIPKGAPLPPFELQASLMSLPWVFRTDLSTIPAEIPYLDVPEEVPNREAILERLTLAQPNTRIGLVWAGSPGHARDDERSLPATALAPLAALPGVVWFSFQLGRKEVPPLPNLLSLGPFLKNFSDTAYALSGMDLVITVDTSVAHLAGAMGIPTLLLLAFQPDFRWLLEREDSPWYPTMRLYRQSAYGDWEPVLRQLVADLMADA
jgi:tetratricopeptide (TPR) repeat protein